MRRSLLLLLLLPIAGCASEDVKPPQSSASDSPSVAANKLDNAPNAAPSAAAESTKPISTAPVSTPPAPAPAPSQPAAAAKPIYIPSGTKLTVFLADPLSSDKNHAGDKFTANLAEPVVIDGKTVIAKGAQVQGKVISAEESARVKGLANMSLALTVVTVGKKAVSISTQALTREADSTKGKDATIVGGAAGIGTAIGAIAGGKKGAATGAIVGGGAGVGTVLATRGKEVEYPVETKLSFTVDKEFPVTP